MRSIYATLRMTRDEAEAALARTGEALRALVEQRNAADATSASISSTGGAKSYTNRTVLEIERKIAAAQLDYDTLLHRLGR